MRINLFIIISVFIILAGCSSKMINDDETLIVATAGDMPPFNFYDSNNNITGYDIDISKEIAKRLNKKVKFEIMPQSRFIPLITSNRVDIIVSALDKLDDLKKYIDYSDYYMYEITYFVVKDNSKINFDSIEEIYGSKYKIGVANGTTASRYIKQMELENNTSIYPSRTDLYLALNNNKVIGILADEDEINFINKKIEKVNQLKKNKDQKDAKTIPLLKKVGIDPLYDHHLCIAVNKNNDSLLKEINSIIKNMKEDGTISILGQKWLDRNPLPKFEINK